MKRRTNWSGEPETADVVAMALFAVVFAFGGGMLLGKSLTEKKLLKASEPVAPVPDKPGYAQV